MRRPGTICTLGSRIAGVAQPTTASTAQAPRVRHPNPIDLMPADYLTTPVVFWSRAAVVGAGVERGPVRVERRRAARVSRRDAATARATGASPRRPRVADRDAA